MLLLCRHSVASCSFATPWTTAHQAPLSLKLSRQEHLSRLPFPSPEDLPNPGIEPSSPVSPALQADSLQSEPPEKEFLPPKPAVKKRGVSQAISHQCVNDRPRVLAFVTDVLVTVGDSKA